MINLLREYVAEVKEKGEIILDRIMEMGDDIGSRVADVTLDVVDAVHQMLPYNAGTVGYRIVSGNNQEILTSSDENRGLPLYDALATFYEMEIEGDASLILWEDKSFLGTHVSKPIAVRTGGNSVVAVKGREVKCGPFEESFLTYSSSESSVPDFLREGLHKLRPGWIFGGLDRKPNIMKSYIIRLKREAIEIGTPTIDDVITQVSSLEGAKVMDTSEKMVFVEYSSTQEDLRSHLGYSDDEVLVAPEVDYTLPDPKLKVENP
jgi:hypothetical protein